MSAFAVAALLAAAVALLVPPSARARVAGLAAQQPVRRSASRPRLATPAVAAGAAGLTVLLFVEGWAGAVAGSAVAAVAFRVLGRLEPRAVRQRRERVTADLPLGVDLFAACLQAGRGPAEALRAVAGAVGGPLGHDLDVVAARLRLGSEPVAVWREVAGAGPMAPLGRAMARSLDTGAPLADGLARLGEDLRRSRRSAAERRARSVGVRAAAPLGLCFLPAFVLVGIVPTVVAAFEQMRLW